MKDGQLKTFLQRSNRPTLLLTANQFPESNQRAIMRTLSTSGVSAIPSIRWQVNRVFAIEKSCVPTSWIAQTVHLSLTVSNEIRIESINNSPFLHLPFSVLMVRIVQSLLSLEGERLCIRQHTSTLIHSILACRFSLSLSYSVTCSFSSRVPKKKCSDAQCGRFRLCVYRRQKEGDVCVDDES